MRNKLIVLCTLITLSLLGYVYLKREAKPINRQQNSESKKHGGALARSLLRDKMFSYGTVESANQERINEIEERLKALEEKSANKSDMSDNDTKRNQSKRRLSGDEMQQWMSETLREKEWDKRGSEQIADQIEKSLEAILTGGRVDDVECGNRFCQATFYNEDGTRFPFKKLIGAPPFMHENLAFNKPDGRVEVYFTRKEGVTFYDLRKEAENEFGISERDESHFVR